MGRTFRLKRFSDYSAMNRPLRDDDYVVLDDAGAVVGRILQIEYGPSAGEWRWTVTSLEALWAGRTRSGIEPDLEAAKAAFKGAWLDTETSGAV